jgi:ABC-2 type transport system permease protein
MKISFSRISAMALKEYRHIIRDKFSLAGALILPMLLVLFFGFIIELNYDNILILIKDNSKTAQSRFLADKISAGSLFKTRYISDARPEIYFENNSAAVILEIDKDFGKNISAKRSDKKASAQILLDGSDNAKAGLVLSYFAEITQNVYPQNRPYEIKTRFLFNPELKSKWLIAPGLIVVIIALISIMLTSLTIAKEYEKGSMELLLSTNISPLEITLGKILPYLVLSLAQALSVFLAARFILGVPFTGGLFVFWISCAVYICCCLALGVLISAAARQQQLAMMISMSAALLPSMLLSGFIFPIENMPLFFRVLTCILPQRWFMEICRGAFLRGAGFGDLILPLGALIFLTVVIILAAVKKFKTDVEP